MAKLLPGENVIEIDGRQFVSGLSSDGLFVLWPCARCGGSGEWYYRSALGHKRCLGCSGNRGQWLRREQVEKKLRDQARANERRAAKQVAKHRAAKRERVLRVRHFLKLEPELHAALKGAPHGDIRRDLAKQLVQWGSLSAKQVAFAIKLAQPKPPEAQKADLPVANGRIEIFGSVLSVKEHDSAYGLQLKMLVEVPVEDGVYRVYGSVPSSIAQDVKRGSVIRFHAQVQRKEFGFGFFSRPTQAEIVAEG